VIAKQGGRRVEGVEHGESRAVQIAENARSSCGEIPFLGGKGRERGGGLDL
jgi:hypothetical protein